MASLELSIIIPTHNSSKTIEKCIDSLKVQSFPREKYEIIVVDDGSKDDTIKLVKKIGVDKVIEIEPCFQGKARNSGVKQSNADFLAFIDSDCEAENGWIKSIILELKKIDAITGPISNGNPNSPVAWAEYFLEFGGFHKNRVRSSVRFLPGCNQGFTKKAFQKTKGFSESRTSEDVLFGQALTDASISAYFIPEIQISHLCRTQMNKVSSNMKMLGKYSVRARKSSSVIKYGRLMTHRSLVPLLFIGKILKAALYSIQGRTFGKYLISFPYLILGTKSFSKGIWDELGIK